MKQSTLLLLSFIVFLLVRCGTHQTESHESKHSFCLTDTMQRLIKTDTVKTDYVENELHLAGKIQAIPSKNIKIYPLISGIVKNLYVELGDYVSEGQPLAEIISSEVAEFEKELANAEADFQIAKKNLHVAKDMFDSKLISEKEYITAQKEVEKAEAELKRLKAIFSIYHINETGTYTLKSPISGYIITKNISQGMQIRSDASDEMMTIADIDKLWAVANVYESDMSKIKIGEKACIETIAYPDSVFAGKIDKIFEMLDPTTRTMKIAIQLDNKNYLLKPEMYARVKLKYHEKYQLPYVPSQSVIFDNSKYYVLVYKNKCDIEIRNIEIEKSNNKRTYIKQGLKPGETIITSSQLLIYDAMVEQ